MESIFNTYNSSFLSKIVSINDYNTHAIAANLYDKIKVLGILPKWIKRERVIDRVSIYTDPGVISSILTETPVINDDRFTYGRGIGKGVFFLSEEINLGKIHEITFEVAFDEELLPFEYVVSPTNIISHDFVLTKTFFTIKIVRDHLNVSIYLDDVLELSSQLTEDEDYILSGEFARISATNFVMGNLKIARDNLILHWWKLNTFKTVEVNSQEVLFTCNQIMFNEYLVYNPQIIVGNCSHEFLDEGLNSKDFYSFWYTICFIFAIAISYSKTLLFLRDTKIKSRFLQSKDIPVGNLGSEDIASLYQNWRKSFEERGTDKILLKKDEGFGVGRRLRVHDFLKCQNNIDLGVNHEIWFDVLILDGDINISIFDAIKFIKIGEDFSLQYSFDSNLVIYDFSSTESFFKIKVIKTVDEIVFHINESVIFNEANLSSTALISSNLCEANTGEDFAIANIRVKSEYISLIYPLNEKNSFFNLPYSKDYYYISKIDSDVSDIYLPDSYHESDCFLNKYNQAVDGEYLRLTRYNEGEFTGGFINGMDFGWWMSQSSVCYNSSFGIPSFNKLFAKPHPINTFSELPFINQELLVVDYNDITISTEDSENVSNGINFANYADFDKFKIFIDSNLNYEFRFKVKITDNLTGFRFGLNGYNSLGGSAYFKDAKTGATISSATAYFYQTDDFPFTTISGHDYVLFVVKIGAYNTSHNSLETTNIGVGRNLIMNQACHYICPVIEVYSKESGVSKDMHIKDMFLGLMDFPVGRGHLGYKNLYIVESKNSSQDSNIINTINDTLIPYNVISKIIHI